MKSSTFCRQRFVILTAALLQLAVVQAATVTEITGLAQCGNTGTLQTPDGTTVRLQLALTEIDKQWGLSRARIETFDPDQALLMVFFNYGPRSVIMRDTHFDIDVFFLDHKLNVTGLQRNLKAHPGRTEPPVMQESSTVHARHIMEMRADSPVARRIKQGMRLQWTSTPDIRAIERCMADVWRQGQG